MAKQLIGKVKGDTGEAAKITMTKADGTLTFVVTDSEGTQTESISTSEHVQSNWAASTDTPAGILNKPELSDVALTGSYTDLSNTPTNVSDFANDAGYLTKTDTVVIVNSTTEPTTQSVGQYWEQTY